MKQFLWGMLVGFLLGGISIPLTIYVYLVVQLGHMWGLPG